MNNKDGGLTGTGDNELGRVAKEDFFEKNLFCKIRKMDKGCKILFFGISMPSILQFLKSPYPIRTNYGRVWIRSALISVFVALFLLVFQPFGISSIEHEWKVLYLLSFAIPCFVALTLSGLIVVWAAIRWNWETHWNVGREILLIMLMPVLVGAANALHNAILFDGYFSFRAFLQMELHTIAIAFFPIVGMVTLDWLTLLRKHEKIASGVALGSEHADAASEGETQLFTFTGENQAEEFSVNLQQLLFIKAECNYVNIVFLSESASTETYLLRRTLSSVHEALNEQTSSVVRCHRSYLVNLDKIQSVSGNAQGLELSLMGSDTKVPVSRKYVPDFRDSA